jgi:hypothetical protein
MVTHDEVNGCSQRADSPTVFENNFKEISEKPFQLSVLEGLTEPTFKESSVSFRQNFSLCFVAVFLVMNTFVHRMV